MNFVSGKTLYLSPIGQFFFVRTDVKNYKNTSSCYKNLGIQYSLLLSEFKMKIFTYSISNDKNFISATAQIKFFFFTP